MDLYQLESWDGFELLSGRPAVLVLGDLRFSKTDMSIGCFPSGAAGLIYKSLAFTITSNVKFADVYLQDQLLNNFDLSKRLSASFHQYDDSISIILRKDGYANCSFSINVNEPAQIVGCELAKL